MCFDRLAGMLALGAVLWGGGTICAGAEQAAEHFQEFYVAPGGSDRNPGSAAKPWATLAHAARALQAGQRVSVRAGTYREKTISPQHSGKAGREIVYRAEPGAKVILDGTRKGDDPVRKGFNFAGRAFQYVRIEGFEIRHYGKPLYFNKKGGPYSNIQILNCNVHHCERGLLLYPGQPHHDWLVKNCRFHHIPEAGVAVSGTRLRFEHCVAEENDDGQGQKGDADGFHVEGGRDITFVDCLSRRNSEDGFDVKASQVKFIRCRSRNNGNNYKLWGDNVTLTNCVAYNAKDTNLTCAGNHSPADKPYRKTLIHCTLASAPPGAHAEGYAVGFSKGSHKIVLRNCLIADVGRPFYGWSKNGRVTIDEDYNVFQVTGKEFYVHEGGAKSPAAAFGSTWKTKFGGGKHSILLKTLDEVGFVNLAKGGLRLQKSSGAAGKGSPKFAQQEDCSSAKRPEGPPDCGAYAAAP